MVSIIFFKGRKLRLREFKGFPKASQLKLAKPRFDSRPPDAIVWALLLGNTSPELVDSEKVVGVSYPMFVISRTGTHSEQQFRLWRVTAECVSAGEDTLFKVN